MLAGRRRRGLAADRRRRLLVLVDRALMAYRWVALLCTIDPGRARRWPP